MSPNDVTVTDRKLVISPSFMLFYFLFALNCDAIEYFAVNSFVLYVESIYFQCCVFRNPLSVYKYYIRIYCVVCVYQLCTLCFIIFIFFILSCVLFFFLDVYVVLKLGYIILIGLIFYYMYYPYLM